MEAELRALALERGSRELASSIFWKPVEFLDSEGSDDEGVDAVDNSDEEASDAEGEGEGLE